MDRGDRALAVLRGRHELEPAVGLQRGADPLGAGGDLVGRDLDAHLRLGADLVGEVRRASRRRAWRRS